MKLTTTLLALGLLVLFTASCSKKKPLTKTQKLSYATGVKMARHYQQFNLSIDPEQIKEAFVDVLEKKQLKLTDKELKSLEYEFTQIVNKKKNKQSLDNLKSAKVEIENYLKQSKGQVTASGLIYKVLKKTKGIKVKVNKKVIVHYTGMLMNGQIFDSSIARGKPATFNLNNIIIGLKEALLMMSVGEKMEVVIPPKLGYGSSDNPSIPANSALKFVIEVLEVK